MYERIMVPLDGARQAEAVLPIVEGLARRLFFEVALVWVVGVARLAYAEKERRATDSGAVEGELQAEAS